MIFISKPPWQHAQGQMCSSTGASIFLREGQMLLKSISSWQWHGKTPKPSALLETYNQRKPGLQCPSFHQSQIIYLNSFRAPLLGKVVKGHEMMKFAPKPRGGDGVLAHSADSLQPRPFWGGKTPRRYLLSPEHPYAQMHHPMWEAGSVPVVWQPSIVNPELLQRGVSLEGALRGTLFAELETRAAAPSAVQLLWHSLWVQLFCKPERVQY